MFELRGKEEEVLICLQQEDRRIRRKDGGGENLPIGFEVLKVRSSWAEMFATHLSSTSSEKIKTFEIISFLSLRPGPGGGEPPQPGAVCGGAGCQLRLHGLPQCDAEGDSGSGSLRRTAHHLSPGRHRTLPPTRLLPLPCPTQVCDSVPVFSKISGPDFTCK